MKDRYLGGLESLERGWREDILMVETTTTITPPSIVRSEWYLDMLFSYMSCTLSPEGSYISVSVWQISRDENVWENTLLDSLYRQLFRFRPPLDRAISWIYYLSWCYLDLEWWRSETNTPNRSYASCIVGLQVLGQYG